MLVPWKSLNDMHMRMAQSNRGEDRRRWRLEAEEEGEVTARAFCAYRCPLDMVTSFKHLGQVISATEDDWLALVRNLVRAKMLGKRVLHILSR